MFTSFIAREMGGITIKEAASKKAVEAEWKGKAEVERIRVQEAEVKYKTAQLELQKIIVKEASAIIQRQLELCKELVLLESNRAKLKTAALENLKVMASISADSARALAKEITEMPTPLSAVECLQKFKEYLGNNNEKFALILEAGRKANLISNEDTRQIGN